MSIRIIVADDHMFMRKQLASLIDACEDMEVIAEAADGLMAVQRAGELRPDVVVMDVNMPGLNGIEATRQIVTASPLVKIIGVSMRCERQVVMAMLQAGAFGYILKDRTDKELVPAIFSVLSGAKYIGAGVETAAPT